MEEFHLPPAARPHSMGPDPYGNIWYTGNGNSTIGKLDPRTGIITEYPTDARDPHTAVFHPNGNLYFTAQQAGMLGRLSPGTGELTQGRIGRLNPETGEIREWPSPSGPDAHPYAFAVVDDVIWYNESGMRPDALVRFDPKTEQFQSWAIPSGVGIIRNFWVTKDGNLLIHQTSSNRVGLVKIQD